MIIDTNPTDTTLDFQVALLVVDASTEKAMLFVLVLKDMQHLNTYAEVEKELLKEEQYKQRHGKRNNDFSYVNMLI